MKALMSNVRQFTAKPASKSSGYKMVNRGNDRGEIYLYGTIGMDWFGEGISAKTFADDLKKLGNVKTIDLRIQSEGGDVFAGKAMYSLLVEHEATIVTHIDGLAASAASFIAMAGKEIRISEGAFVMIHNAWTWAVGGADDMRRTADLLDTVNATIRDVYAARTKNTDKKIKEWMDAETWMTGKDAVANGFADSVVENMKVAASIRDPDRFKHLPAALRPSHIRANAAIAKMRAAMR